MKYCVRLATSLSIGEISEKCGYADYRVFTKAFNGKTLLELIDAEELTPVLLAMQKSLEIGMEQTKTVFITVFLFAHGYASMIANNSLKYDEDTIDSHLERAYRGAILAAQEEME